MKAQNIVYIVFSGKHFPFFQNNKNTGDHEKSIRYFFCQNFQFGFFFCRLFQSHIYCRILKTSCWFCYFFAISLYFCWVVVMMIAKSLWRINVLKEKVRRIANGRLVFVVLFIESFVDVVSFFYSFYYVLLVVGLCNFYFFFVAKIHLCLAKLQFSQSGYRIFYSHFYALA